VRWQKMALLQNLGCGLGLCGFANVPFCGGLQKIKKMCGGEIKNTEGSALCFGKVVH
jgi:hypothetical protein